VKKSAFTLIELIIIIVVVGILSAAVYPRMERDALREAAEQVARHIKYAQHLAMVDDVFNDQNTSWFKNRWAINLCSTQYSLTRVNGTQTAIDPFFKLAIDGTTNDSFDLASEYGVATMQASPTSTVCKIAFDNQGRPYALTDTEIPANPTANLLQNNDINITLSDGDRNMVITVTEQSGYTFIN
jgi:prepilin-type N-terminal cleavage/methylation domain-containing protein